VVSGLLKHFRLSSPQVAVSTSTVVSDVPERALPVTGAYQLFLLGVRRTAEAFRPENMECLLPGECQVVKANGEGEVTVITSLQGFRYAWTG